MDHLKKLALPSFMDLNSFGSMNPTIESNIELHFIVVAFHNL
jgi:hypothetical protein